MVETMPPDFAFRTMAAPVVVDVVTADVATAAAAVASVAEAAAF